MSDFYSLVVSNLSKETKECVAISFEVPENIAHKFNYLPGQYLTLKMKVGGEEIRRSYSICSSPLMQEKLTVAIKKVKSGKGSTFLNEAVKVGDTIEVMTPMGNFNSPLDSNNKKTYVLFAGGSGITPMMSIIKTILIGEPLSNLILIYGNENESAIIFKNQLDQLVLNSQERLKIFHILNSPSGEHHPDFKGIMNVDKVSQLLPKLIDLSGNNEYFICGPGGMMDSVVQVLNDARVDKSHIHVEYFVAPVNKESDVSTSNPIASELTVICDGDELTLNLKAGETVLEAALAAGIDAPYACQGGSCCTCRAKLVEGKVFMKINYALLETEVQEGFILTCQAQALTPKLIVDYDRGR